MASKPGRNSPCPCGSGKKYKHCCLVAGASSAPRVTNLAWPKLRRTEDELVAILLSYAEHAYGPDAWLEAWDEFSLWNDVPFEPDVDPNVDSLFIPWFVFNWIPDNAESDPADHLPTVTIAQHYLANPASTTSAFQRRFINEVCSQPYSFFTVVDVDPGQALTLKDLLLDRTIRVQERQASMTLSNGMIVFARIMALDGATIMVGCAPTVIPAFFWSPLLDLRDDLFDPSEALTLDTLLDHDLELRTVYYQIVSAVNESSLPRLQNTDGDPLELIQLVYSLNCTPAEALEALRTLAIDLSPEELLQPAEFDAQGELLTVEVPWLEQGNAKNKGWNTTVLGQIVIRGDSLTIDVNSQTRADAIKRKITRRLGKRAVFRRAIIQSSQKLMEDLANEPDHSAPKKSRHPNSDLAEDPAVQAQIRQMAAQHWASWFDEPIPALHNETPRQAAATPKGRVRLEALLLEYEAHDTALGAGASENLLRADIPALRKALGLD